MALLYRQDGELHFVMDQVDVTITPDTVVELHQDPTEGTQVLDILPQQGRGIRWTYEPPEIDPPLGSDPTAFVEREQFDFGLFVFNVLSDRERRQRIYQ